MYRRRSAQLALSLGGHFGENMAFIGAFAFIAGTSFLKPFRGTFVGLQLTHYLLRICGLDLFLDQPLLIDINAHAAGQWATC
jgi:hypothetical protein